MVALRHADDFNIVEIVAATSQAPAPADDPQSAHAPLISEELTRESRGRVEEGRLERRPRLLFAAVAGLLVVSAALTAHGLPQGPPFAWSTAALYVVLYAAVSRVEFEIGTGAAIPTQLVLVPMLFVLPVGTIPALVAAGLVLAGLANRSSAFTADRLAVWLASATQTLGPVLVLAFAGGTPLRWSAWPIYLAALAAQFAFDFLGAATTSGIGHGVPMRTLTAFLRWVFVVDLALAPVGLLAAFATVEHPKLVVLLLPLVLLLRHFSHERRWRLDHALELSEAYRGTAFLLGDVVEADDQYTGEHSRQVVEFVLKVCADLGLDARSQRKAEFAALLHDIGKIKIPSEIINKPGTLTAEERAVINTHTIEGEALLLRIGGLLGEVGGIVRSCHERYDGSGYPDGLVGDAIPFVARIVSCCDAYDAMTTDRSYRKALTTGAALAELQTHRGTQFDPIVVDALAAIIHRA